jgi:hypothetical protein
VHKLGGGRTVDPAVIPGKRPAVLLVGALNQRSPTASLSVLLGLDLTKRTLRHPREAPSATLHTATARRGVRYTPRDQISREGR